MGIAVALKFRPTGQADEMVDRFAVHGFGMLIPPGHAAFIGAESLFLMAGCMCERFGAASAKVLGIRAETISAAVGLDCIN